MEDKEITDRELLEIASQRRRDLKAYEPQELQPLNDTPLDSLTKLRNRFANKGKGKQRPNLWEAPDREYIKIPNRFFEAACRQYLRPNETKVLLFLVRKTWGWKKKSEFIPLKQFSQQISIAKDKASRALSSLAKRGIVVQLGNRRYAIQADTSLWKDRPKKKRKQSK